MRSFITEPAAARRRSDTGLLYLVISGLLWGTGGLTGSLLGRTAGLSAISVAACRLTAGGVLIIVFLTVTGRRWPPGRAAWTRITVIGLLAALYQSCYFTAVSLTSVQLATLVTIGAAPVIVLGADRVTGRRAGRLAGCTTGLAVTGLGLLVGLPSGGFSERRCWPARGWRCWPRRASPRSRWSAPGRCGTGRPHRDRVRVHPRRPGPAAAGPGRRPGRLQPGSGHASACWSRSAPARPPWPTRCTSAACGPPRPARPPC